MSNCNFFKIREEKSRCIIKKVKLNRNYSPKALNQGSCIKENLTQIDGLCTPLKPRHAKLNHSKSDSKINYDYTNNTSDNASQTDSNAEDVYKDIEELFLDYKKNRMLWKERFANIVNNDDKLGMLRWDSVNFKYVGTNKTGSFLLRKYKFLTLSLVHIFQNDSACSQSLTTFLKVAQNTIINAIDDIEAYYNEIVQIIKFGWSKTTFLTELCKLNCNLAEVDEFEDSDIYSLIKSLPNCLLQESSLKQMNPSYKEKEIRDFPLGDSINEPYKNLRMDTANRANGDNQTPIILRIFSSKESFNERSFPYLNSDHESESRDFEDNSKPKFFTDLDIKKILEFQNKKIEKISFGNILPYIGSLKAKIILKKRHYYIKSASSNEKWIQQRLEAYLCFREKKVIPFDNSEISKPQSTESNLPNEEQKLE